MYPMTINPLQPAFSCGHFQPALALPAIRELSDEEMDMVSGGIAPAVIVAAKITGAAFATGFGTTLGIAAGNAFVDALSSEWGGEEQACR